MTISYQRDFSQVVLRHSNSLPAVLIIRQSTSIIVAFCGWSSKSIQVGHQVAMKTFKEIRRLLKPFRVVKCAE